MKGRTGFDAKEPAITPTGPAERWISATSLSNLIQVPAFTWAGTDATDTGPLKRREWAVRGPPIQDFSLRFPCLEQIPQAPKAAILGMIRYYYLKALLRSFAFASRCDRGGKPNRFSMNLRIETVSY